MCEYYMDSERYHDVTVIGSGWSGLLATKYMLEEGLTVVALEKRDNLGGLWYYSDDESINTVMKSTCATSSRTITEMSDFPMPEDRGEFLHHSDMLQYLHAYANEFNLLPHIHFNTTVSNTVKQNDMWHTTTEDNDVVYISKYIVVATGLVHLRNTAPKDSLFKNFTGRIYHAGELKEPKQEHKGCKLLIYGGGETGADICTEWHGHADKIYWSIPNGQHFFRRYSRIPPWRKLEVLDKVSSHLLLSTIPLHKSMPGQAWLAKWTTNGSLLAYQGHGIPEWRNSSDLFHCVVNKSATVLDLIDYETVVPKASVEKCEGKTIIFSDGESTDFDVIILSTGYRANSCLIFQHKKVEQNPRNRYKHVFDPNDSSIAFIGHTRPVLGSIPAIAEVQAQWAAKVFSGSVSLPSIDERHNIIKKDKAFWSEYFKHLKRSNEILVEMIIYITSIATEAGVYPNRYKLFKSNPYHWYVSMVAPYNSCYWRLNEPKHRERAIKTLQKHAEDSGIRTPFIVLFFAFLRLIWFDWILQQLDKLKYRAQTSKRANQLAKTAPVKFVNSIWCIPKKVFFE